MQTQVHVDRAAALECAQPVLSGQVLSVLTRLRFLFSGVRSLCGAGTPPPPPSAAPGGGDVSGCVPRLQGCSGHGRCDAADNSTCICEATWLGESCETPLVPSSATALDGSSAAGSAPAGGWQCYAYSVRTEGHLRHLTIEMNASAGDPDLYVKHGSYPTLFDYGFPVSSPFMSFAPPLRAGASSL